MTVKGVKSKPVVPYTVTAGAEIMICQCALLVRSCAQTLEYRSTRPQAHSQATLQLS